MITSLKKRQPIMVLALAVVTLMVGCGEPAPADRSAHASEALADYRARMQREQSSQITSNATPVEPTSDRNSPSNSQRVIAADTLEILDQFITPEDVLDPIRPQLSQWSREMPPSRYVAAAAELVRESLVEQVANHLIYRRAAEQVTPEMETQIDLAVNKMEQERIGREFDGRETAYVMLWCPLAKSRRCSQPTAPSADCRDLFARPPSTDDFRSNA